MIDKKYLELIHKDIDKVITPREKVKLDNYLKNNPEAEELYHELAKTEELLDTLPDVDPTENLKKRIMNSLDYNKYAQNRKRSILDGLFKRRRPVFALGVVAALILIGLFISNPNLITTFDQKDVAGTMGMRSAEQVEMLDIEIEGVSGSIQVIKGSGMESSDYSFGFSVELISSGNYELEIAFDPSITTFEEIISHDNLVTDRRDDAVMINSGGHSFYSVLFSSEERSGVFNITIFRDGAELYGQQVLVK
jgi:hypothetical protein